MREGLKVNMKGTGLARDEEGKGGVKSRVDDFGRNLKRRRRGEDGSWTAEERARWDERNGSKRHDESI